MIRKATFRGLVPKIFAVSSNWVSKRFNAFPKSNKTKGKDYDAKTDYIAENVMTKYDVRSFLKKFVTKTGINWYDLKLHMRLVKKSLYKRIKRRLEKMIEH